MPCAVTEQEKFFYKYGYDMPNKWKDSRNQFQSNPISENWLEGALCALLTELETNLDVKTFDNFIDKVETNGSIEHIRLWKSMHVKADINRLKTYKKDSVLSTHELAFIEKHKVKLKDK